MTPQPSVDDSEIARISDVMRRLRVLIGRRVISRVAIANVAPGAELSFIDVLAQIPGDDGDAHGITIGAIAQGMRIDPSRASRLVAKMVDQGILARVASPTDARSSTLVRTELGQKLHQEMRAVKRGFIEDAVAGWSAEEIETFATQFERFIGQWEHSIDAGHSAKRP